MAEIVLPESLSESHALIRQLLTIIQHEHTQYEALASKFAELEARVNQNSRNSSRPPSSNFGKNTPKQTTQAGIPKEKKDQGEQKGHTGNTLHKIEHPDEIVQLSTPLCSCGQFLAIEDTKIVQTYQVFDLPQPKLYVTEYQRLEQICPCGRVHLAKLPDDIHANFMDSEPMPFFFPFGFYDAHRFFIYEKHIISGTHFCLVFSYSHPEGSVEIHRSIRLNEPTALNKLLVNFITCDLFGILIRGVHYI